jgi:PAS domain S-box-containing protein
VGDESKTKTQLIDELEELRQRVAILAEIESLSVERAGKRAELERGAALETLPKSEERFKSIFDESPIGIELYDAAGRLLDANRACLDMFGVSDVAEVQGFRLFEDPSVSEGIKEGLLKGHTARYEAPFDFEKVKALDLYGTSRSGVVHLDVLITPLGLRERGFVSGYLLQVQDITERVRAESQRDATLEALREAHDDLEMRVEERTAGLLQVNQTLREEIAERRRVEQALKREKEFTERLIESSVDGILAFDRDYRYTVWNPGMERIAGVSKKECIGKYAFDVFPFLKEMGEDWYFDAALAGKSVVAKNRPYTVPEAGQQGFFEGHYAPLYGASGEIIGGLAIIRDITEQTQAEKELLEKECIIESASSVITAADLEGNMTYVNPAFLETWGLDDAQEILGRHLMEFWMVEERLDEIMEALWNEGCWSDEVRARRADGSLFDVQMSAAVVFDKAGEPIRLMSTSVDITEQVRGRGLLRLQRDLGIALSEAGDLTQALERLLEITLQVKGIDSGGVYLVDPLGGELNLVAHKGLHPQFAEGVSQYGADAPQARLVMAGEPIYRQYPHVLAITENQVRQSESLRALAVIPVKHEDEDKRPLVVASLNLASHTHDEIPAGTRDALEAIAAQIGGVIARVRAESQRDATLEALRESEAKLQSIFRAAPTGIGLVSERVLLQVNDRICEMLGYSCDELVGQSARVLYPSDEDFEYVGREYAQVRERGTGTVETRWQHKDGRIVDVLLSSTPFDPANLSAGVTFTALDITERLRAESQRDATLEALRRSEQRFRTFFEKAPIGMSLREVDLPFEEHTVLEDFNPAMQKFLGYSEQELRHVTMAEFSHPEDLKKDTELFDEMLAGKFDHYEMEKRFIRKDGQIVWGLLGVTCLWSDEGHPTHILGTVNDINERKRAEAERDATLEALQQAHRELAAKAAALEQANAELEQYAYVVSHDLKAPLRAIHNYADFLREDLAMALDEEQKAYLDGLGLAVCEGEELVGDLLELSRIGRRSVPIETVDVGAFLRELSAILISPADVEIVMAEDWPTMDVEPVLLGQIFQNLIGNAIKFNHAPRKRVELGWRPLGEAQVELFVRDNGIGIDPRYHEKIFRAFERLHAREEYEGTGIGLAIVKKAADKLRGLVRVESEPGEGSTFFVTLPLKQEEVRT